MAISGKESRPAKIFETMNVGGRRSLKRTAMLDDTPMAKATGSSNRRSTKKSPNRKRVMPLGARGRRGGRAGRRGPVVQEPTGHREALHEHEGGADRDAEVD